MAAVTVPGFAQTTHSIAEPLDTFINASSGAFGDEGPRLTAALDAMDAQLAAWDAAVRRVEQGFAADVGSATPTVAAQMRTALGAVYLQRGRPADAVRQLQAAAALNPGVARTDLLLGAALAAAGDDRGARAAWQRAWKASPDDPVAAYLSSSISAGRPAPAPALVQTLLDAAMKPNSEQPLRLPSLTPFDDAAVPTPVFALARYAGAVVPLRSGDYRAALAALRAGAAADPLAADPATRASTAASGIAALRTGEIARAVRELREAVAAAPTSSEVHRTLAMALWADQQTDAARAEFEAALRLRPDDERTYLALADMLADASEDTAARTVLQRAVMAIPRSGQAHWRLAQLANRMHRDADALAQYEACLSVPPIFGAGRVYAEIGRLQQARVDPAGAERAYRQWVRLQPDVPAAHRALADLYATQDRNADALVERLAVALLDPRDAASYAAVAQTLAGLGRTADAEQAARRAVSIDPDDKEARYILSTAHERQGRHDESARELAVFMRLQQRWLEAERRTFAVNSLKLQAQVATDPGQRAATWRQIVDAEQPTAGNEANLGDALAAAGRIEDAIAAYKMAVALGHDPAAYRALIGLYEKAGRRDEADAARADFDRAKADRIRRLGASR